MAAAVAIIGSIFGVVGGVVSGLIIADRQIEAQRNDSALTLLRSERSAAYAKVIRLDQELLRKVGAYDVLRSSRASDKNWQRLYETQTELNGLLSDLEATQIQIEVTAPIKSFTAAKDLYDAWAGCTWSYHRVVEMNLSRVRYTRTESREADRKLQYWADKMRKASQGFKALVRTDLQADLQ